jgi:hypothetical protein
LPSGGCSYSGGPGGGTPSGAPAGQQGGAAAWQQGGGGSSSSSSGPAIWCCDLHQGGLPVNGSHNVHLATPTQEDASLCLQPQDIIYFGAQPHCPKIYYCADIALHCFSPINDTDVGQCQQPNNAIIFNNPESTYVGTNNVVQHCALTPINRHCDTLALIDPVCPPAPVL